MTDGAKLTHKTVPLSSVTPHPRNVRQGDVGAICQSLEAHGQYRPLVVQASTGHILAGNHTWRAMESLGWKRVAVSFIDVDDDEALRILLVDNRSNDLATYDDHALAALLQELAESDRALQGTGFDGDDLDDLNDLLQYGTPEQQPRLDNQLPSPRVMPLDVIFTHTFTGSCCMAVAAGLSYGIQSTKKPCPYTTPTGKHRVLFVDNDWKNYRHSVHVAAVEKMRPKYATTRDLVTRQQAAEFGVEYLTMAQTLEMAEEIGQYAENPMLIPKYDCLDDIPEKYVLGYSVPTSHGGTPLPPEAFKGRRVHLLGGSWREQLKYLSVLGEDVVSLDNNYISRAAMFACYCNPDGSIGQLSRTLNLTEVANPAAVSLAISLGHIATGVKRILGQTINVDKQVQQQKGDFHE